MCRASPIRADVWYNISGVDPPAESVTRTSQIPGSFLLRINGYGFGETSGYGNTFGENFVAVMSGVLTAPRNGQLPLLRPRG